MEIDGENGYEFDLVTIGAGSGGVRASRMAAGTYGAKVRSIKLQLLHCDQTKLQASVVHCKTFTAQPLLQRNHLYISI